MLISKERLDLQLFGAPGDGGDGAGEGAATNTVATPADDGQQFQSTPPVWGVTSLKSS